MKLKHQAIAESRRRLLIQLGASAAGLLLGAVERTANATIITRDEQGNVVIRGPGPMPPPQPASLFELIVNNTLVVYLGKFKRQVWVVNSLTKKLIEGERVDANERRLYEAHELGSERMGTGYLEIEDARPILVHKDAQQLPLPRGTIYCYGYNSYDNEEFAGALENFVGRQAIFLFYSNRLWGNQKRLYPEATFSRSPGNIWQDELPLPTEQLTRVRAMALTHDFIEISDRPIRSPRRPS